ncbi:hypothetical protein [Microvirga zambiensis]|uniref:hypothetical protein n=1 Tax=Microvirga zambiensis TaxID=1402137 RepID=UPI00191F86CE|nr:hypothetical protein [Microvirga zambiensis]
MFTVEIGGIPIATTNADEAQAQDVFASAEFRHDLMAMTSGGTPLWDGKAPLTVRPALRHEAELFNDPGLDENEFDDETEDDSVFVAFLVPVDHNHEEMAAIPPELQS